MKICFICSEYPPGPHGGIGIVTYTLAHALAAKGHSVHVIGVYSKDYPAPDYQDDNKVRVWRIREKNFKWIGWFFARFVLFWKVLKWAQTGEINCVDVPDYQGWVAAWPKLPVPVISRLHGSSSLVSSELKKDSSKLSYWLESLSLKRSDYWISVSDYTLEKTKYLFRLPEKKAKVIYNAVDIPLHNSNLSARKVVIFVGTLNENKGIERLIMAWQIVRTVLPDAKLQIFGKDWEKSNGISMKKFLLDLLHTQNIGGVYFQGHVSRDRLYDELSFARIAIFPSRYEAFGLTALEAMANGCATIFTNRASGPELIENGVDGLLVDPENYQEIAEAIIRLLNDDALTRRLGEEGRQKVKDKFSLQKIILENERFFEECIIDFQKNKNENR